MQKDTTPIYIIQTHGSENLKAYEKRAKVPDGCTLVIFTPTSVPIYTKDACKITDFLRNPRNRKKLQSPDIDFFQTSKYMEGVRVYHAGDPMPSINMTLTSEFISEDYIRYDKAGVYLSTDMPTVSRTKFPAKIEENMEPHSHRSRLDRGLIKVSNCYKYVVRSLPKDQPLDTDTYEEIYRGAILKPSLESIQAKTPRFNLFQTIKKLGPGTYYYLGCRSGCSGFPEEIYKESIDILHKAELLHNQKNLKKAQVKFEKLLEKMHNGEKVDNLSPGSNSSEDSFSRQISFDPYRTKFYNIRYGQKIAKSLAKQLERKNISPNTEKKAIYFQRVFNEAVPPTIYETLQKSDEAQEKKRKPKVRSIPLKKEQWLDAPLERPKSKTSSSPHSKTRPRSSPSERPKA